MSDVVHHVGEGRLLALIALKAFRKMRGGSQSQLMLCSDQCLWVVKFQNNPQHIRVLANELIATRLAEEIGLTVAKPGVINVSESLVYEDPRMEVELPRGARERYSPGQNFGCKFAGGLMPGHVVDYLPDEQLREICNLNEFAGILALDKWTANQDGRQAVFRRSSLAQKYQAVFIDQGYCFDAGEWRFSDSPLRGVFARNVVYDWVRGWESFEPWLSRIERLDEVTLLRIAEEVPPRWYGGDKGLIRLLMKQLFVRRSRIRELIVAFRDSDRDPFPLWKAHAAPQDA